MSKVFVSYSHDSVDRELSTGYGLCLVTTRYSLPDLRAFWQTTAPEMKLLRLTRDAGVQLLQTLGVRGATREFETLVEDVKGHALTLPILGGFLRRAFGGDIRQRDRVKFEKADEKCGHGKRIENLRHIQLAGKQNACEA